jgi:hypothetical protein
MLSQLQSNSHVKALIVLDQALKAARDIGFSLRCILTDFTELRLSWDACSFPATEHAPGLLRNSKVYCIVHKNPLQVPVLSQVNPVHPFHSISLRCILILSSQLRLGLNSGPLLQMFLAIFCLVFSSLLFSSLLFSSLLFSSLRIVCAPAEIRTE